MSLLDTFIRIGVKDETDRGMASAEQSVLGRASSLATKAASVLGVAFAVDKVKDFGVAAIGAYSDFEQLSGGVEKIFNEMDTSKIYEDANRAYAELNMSANEYMATINDVGAMFSATMGDEAGYETARKGMLAISDYASGTGKNIDVLSEKFAMITRSTSSYQSIADQFSGILPATSKDFLEQAQAAGFLSDEYASLTEVPIDEYQAAVSEMLAKGTEELGLQGNTAAEAFGTIAGSIAATKSAFSDWLAELGKGDGDVKAATEKLAESAIAAVKNIVPRVGEVFESLGEIAADMLPDALGEAAELASEFLMDKFGSTDFGVIGNTLMMQLATSLSDGMEWLGNAVTEYGPTLVQKGLETIKSLSAGLRASAGTLIDAGLALAKNLAQGLADSLPAIIENVPEIVSNIAGVINDNAPKVLAAGWEIIKTLAKGLVEAGPVLVENIPQILQALWDAFTAFNWLALGRNLITLLASGVRAGIGLAGGAARSVASGIKSAISNLPSTLATLGRNAISFLANGVRGMIGNARGAVSGVASAAKAAITSLPGEFASIGSNIISSLAAAIRGGLSSVVGAIKNVVGSAVKAGKSALGINSPSKVFRAIGAGVVEGFVQGIDWNASDAVSAVSRMASSVISAGSGIPSFSATAVAKNGYAAAAGYGGNITINLNYDAGADANQMVRDIARGIERVTMMGA